MNKSPLHAAVDVVRLARIYYSARPGAVNPQKELKSLCCVSHSVMARLQHFVAPFMVPVWGKGMSVYHNFTSSPQPPKMEPEFSTAPHRNHPQSEWIARSPKPGRPAPNQEQPLSPSPKPIVELCKRLECTPINVLLKSNPKWA